MTTVLTLAVAICANATIFDVVSSVLLNPLPYAHPDRLVAAYETDGSGVRGGVSLPDLQDWQQQARSFARFAIYSPGSAALTGAGHAIRVRTAAVTPGFFRAFGVPPVSGTVITQVEPGVVISEGFWRRHLGAAEIAGRRVALDGKEHPIVGVMPARFDFPRGTDVWAPLDTATEFAGARRSSRYLRVIGELMPGVTVAAAQAELDVIARRLAAEHPRTNANVRPQLVGLQESLTTGVRPTLLLLTVMAGLVLLVACSNVANLILARAAARRTDIAVRAALGATRSRLVRQLLTESAVLVIIGAVLGVLFASWSAHIIRASRAMTELPLTPNLGSGLVLLFSLVLVGATVLLVGVWPALKLSRTELTERLKQSGGRATAQGIRGLLVASQMALAAFLLIGATLTGRSMLRLQSEPLGFDPADVYLVSAKPRNNVLGAPRLDYELRLLERLRSLPGVTGAAITNAAPLGSAAKRKGPIAFRIEGQPPNIDDEAGTAADVRVVSDAYFATLGIPPRRGREFLPGDGTAPLPVVLINETAARAYWPGRDPVGSRIAVPDLSEEGPVPWRTVVGVVPDVREAGFDAEPRPLFYVPLGPESADIIPDVVVRSTLPLAQLQALVQSAVASVDRDVPAQVTTMEELVATSVALPRLRVVVVGIFAAIALVLVSIGVYGVAAQVTLQRAPEMAIRLALGAQPGRLLARIVGSVSAYALLGLGVGLVGSAMTARVVRHFLYGIEPTDLTSFGVVTALLTLLALLSCFLPARGVVRIEPVQVLRGE